MKELLQQLTGLQYQINEHSQFACFMDNLGHTGSLYFRIAKDKLVLYNQNILDGHVYYREEDDCTSYVQELINKVISFMTEHNIPL